MGGDLGDGFPTPDGTVDGSGARRLVDLLLIDYLRSTVPTVFSILSAAGIVEITFTPAPAPLLGFLKRTIHYDAIATFFENPTNVVKAAFKWGTSEFSFDAVAEALALFLSRRGYDTELIRPDEDLADGYLDAQTTVDLDSALRVAFVRGPLGGAEFEAGATLIQLPGDPPGMIIQPSVPSHLDLDLGGGLRIIADSNVSQTFGLLVRPGTSDVTLRYPFDQGGAAPAASAALVFAPATASVLLGSALGSRVEVAGAKASVGVTTTSGAFEVIIGLTTVGAQAVIEPGESDGFVSSLVGGKRVQVPLDLSIRWSNRSGLSFGGGGKFEVSLSPNVHAGPFEVPRLHFAVSGRPADAVKQTPAALLAEADADVTAAIGPVSAVVQGIGVDFDLGFAHGNLGVFDLDVGFKPPTGVGLSINAGSVSGGGFISLDPDKGRYFGALELSVYGVAVKAFGIIETKVPGVSFSFLIIISAEFTPIQLGLGFTLNGVGGIAGINRTVDAKGLLDAVRTGRLENVLFPHDVVHDAPAIVHDVGVLFPPAASHYVFGPLAKIGWGTPTLVEAELGLVLELPGPRLVILGTVHAALPTKEDPIVELNLDVGGLIDFPKKYFALDASLHDSRVGDYPVSGDMSMRLTWGPNPNFALAVGGFNPHYNPPPSFPKLRPVTVDLSQHSNPSINLHGYMALTSNTAQVGAQLEARVSGGGADLYGFLGFDALFVFSPFSFMADIEGGVSVSFHGHGFSLNFHGHISGPSPWHLDGKVCVSILFWDACVGFSVNLGGTARPTLPGLDPWDGTAADNVQKVLGLMEAIADVKNWAGGAPPASTNVVTLVAAPPNTPAPVDPLGSATLRQKIVPLQLPITRFAGTKPRQARTFDISQITIGQTITPGQDPATVVTVSKDKLKTVSDFFAPGEYQDLKAAQKLSSPSFVQMAAGVTFSSDAVDSGQVDMKGLTYHSIVLNADGTESDNDDYTPTSAQVTSTTSISAAALAGIRAAALGRFVDPTALPKVSLNPDGYVLSSTSTLKVAPGFNLGQPVPRPVAFGALLSAALTDPTAPQSLQVTPVFNALP